MTRVLLAVLLLGATGRGVEAQGWVERVGPGTLGVHKLRTNVRVTVAERVAHVEVEEWFRNDGPPFGEADYLYPLPVGASFSSYSLWQGDAELRGEMLDAGEARRIYEEIVRSKRDPALIELVGHGLVRARVFPIATGETRRIVLRYSQVLSRAGDALEFRYAAGRRQAGGGVRPAVREGPPPADAARGEGTPLSFTLTVKEGAQYAQPFSPTHALRITRERGELRVASRERLSGDFALFLPFADRPVGISVVTHRPAQSEDGYFMLTLSPAEAARAARVPRDVTLVLDVSGSMSGGKLEQARSAAKQLLGTLGASDRVRLIRFHSTVASWRPEWVAATPAALREARAWVDRLQAEGGTNISGALQEAFDARTPEARLGVVVFLTDGLPSAGERDPEQIALQAERERGAARVFAFGVGYDVNTYLLDRLSAAARGTTQYVKPDDDIEQAMATLSAKIQYPVLTDLALDVEGASVSEIYPVRMPDLFAGEELVVFGRYAPGSGTGSVAVRGRRTNRPERYAARVTFARHAPGHDYIPRLWATRKVGELERELRLHGHDAELVEEIRRTALRYGVLSEYSAYLVQEPGIVADAAGGRVRGQAGNALMAPPPAASVGQAAVERSESARKSREVSSVADMVQLQEQVASAAGTRAVAGRTFRERGGVWQDALYREGGRVLEVKAFSPAYFALLRALPELAPYASELEQFVVSGAGAAVRVHREQGVNDVASNELAKWVRDFRGERAVKR